MNLMEKSTDDLMKALEGTASSQVQDYFRAHFAQGEPTFSGYIDALLGEKHLKRQDVLIRANLPQKYGYRLLSGQAHTTDRNKILRICFSMEMTLKETQRTLRLYGMNELYPKVKRDVVLIVALGQKIFDIDRVNELLAREGEAPLYDAADECAYEL